MISIIAGLMLQAAALEQSSPAPATPPPAPSRKRGKSSRASGKVGGLIGSADYPPEALRNDEEGITGFRLQIGIDGKVTSCAITSSSGSAVLDATTCKLITERARYTPAYNKRGKPVPDSVAARIVWTIDASQRLLPLAPSLSASTVRVSPGGEAVCSYVEDAHPPVPAACPDTSDSEMVAAAHARGKTLEQTIVSTVTPDGTAELVDTADHGTQYVAAEALLSIAPDGSLLECRVVRNETLGPAAGRPSPVLPCSNFPLGRARFQPLAGADRPGIARLRIRVYYRL